MNLSKFLSVCILFLFNSLNAYFVTVEDAQNVAFNFYKQQNASVLPNDKIRLHHVIGLENQPTIYIFNMNESNHNAYILVSADDVARPVLGYSYEDTFNYQEAPEHLIAWLGDYHKSILWAIENHINATEDIKLAWDQLRKNKSIIGKRRGSVSPIISAKWNQIPYYNDQCPLDGNKRSVVGCVATAMAQVIHHWQYPVKGSGFHSYSHSKLGTISANFGNTTYNYANMPNSISSKNNDVALLSFHCGVAVEMNYSAQSSGAYVINSASPVTHCAEYALKKYFNYPSSVSGQERDNYTYSNWINKVNSELDNSRPIIYAGFGNGGGHAFIFDGYDNGGKYHINWGWGGAYNGYFEIDALNPDGLGTGGGTGSYNAGHQAIFGVEAPDNTQTDASISIYGTLSTSASQVSYGQAFAINTKAANVSGKDFSGNLAIAVFDDSFNFVEFVGEKSNVSLQDNYAFNDLAFESAGSLTMLPGQYHLYLCYKNNGGDWKIANDYGGFTNYASLQVIYYNDIELYSDLKVTNGPIKKGQSVNVSYNVANTGSTTFRGTYAVGLYYMDGSFGQMLGSTLDNSGLPPSSVYNNEITITSPAIDLEPGTYLMAVQYQATGSSNWTLVGSYYKVNPIKVIVEEAPIKPDAYEPNNDVVSAYNLNLNYFNNTASWSSNITNVHQESDVDFFRVDFEKDYVYTLDVKISDLNKTYSSKTYTLDSRFSLSDDGVFWSPTYINQLPTALKVNGKDKDYVLIRVVPAFAGLTGDYDLTVAISRESTLSTEAIDRQFAISPNPANESLQISATTKAANYEVYQTNGSIILQGTLDDTQKIHIAPLNPGVYFLKLETQSGLQTLKFIKE